MLQSGWMMEGKGYTRSYLNNGMWSNNDDWDEIARTIFKVFLILYLLPPETAGLAKRALRQKKQPAQQTHLQPQYPR